MSILAVSACGGDPAPAPEAVPVVPAMADAFAAGAAARITGASTNEPAAPPAQVDVWNNPQRAEVACRLAVGVEVTVTASAYRSDEARWYYEVTAGVCRGWVESTSLAPPAVPVSAPQAAAGS